MFGRCNIVKPVWFRDCYEELDIVLQMELLQQFLGYCCALMHNMPSTFESTLIMYMDTFEVSRKQLWYASNIAPRSIQRMRMDCKYMPSLETVIALCIALQLPPYLSYDLIHKAGFSLKYTEKHMVYHWLLHMHWQSSVDDCNKILSALGLAPLTINE